MSLQVLGLDPGCQEVFVASNAPGHEKGETITRFTGAQYRSVAFFIHSEDKQKAWRKADGTYQAVLDGIPTDKTVSTETLRVGWHKQWMHMHGALPMLRCQEESTGSADNADRNVGQHLRNPALTACKAWLQVSAACRCNSPGLSYESQLLSVHCLLSCGVLDQVCWRVFGWLLLRVRHCGCCMGAGCQAMHFQACL